MIEPFTLSSLAPFVDGQLIPGTAQADAEFSSLSTDSRQLQSGDVYVALSGERFDGHSFIEAAIATGAVGLVVSRVLEALPVPQLLVKDTIKALGKIAATHRAKFSGAIVGITGSSGKTTVKGMLSAILSVKHSVLATKGNLNNHIGVPLTLMKLNGEHQLAVIEMGASAIGEIAYLSELVKPTVSVINNVMPAHLQGFGSLDGVAKAKGEIYEGLDSSGIAVINIDEPYAQGWQDSATTEKFCLFSATSDKADFFASNTTVNAAGCVNFDLHSPEGKISIRLSVMGEHNLMNALAAAACAYKVGASLNDIRIGLENFSGVSGRMQVLAGQQGSLVIDDSYNAHPGSMKAAIDVLAEKKALSILVAGDMGELGDTAIQQHQAIGRYAKEKKITTLLAVGPLSLHTAQSFGTDGHHFEAQADLLIYLETLLDSNVVVLVKGSRSSNMDAIVRQISLSGEE